MAQHEKYFTCDIGGERHEDKRGVRNDITIVDGDNNRIYNDVCDKHIDRVCKFLDEEFRNNKCKKTV